MSIRDSRQAIVGNGELDIAEISLADMDLEDIRAELRRAYTQLEVSSGRQDLHQPLACSPSEVDSTFESKSIRSKFINSGQAGSASTTATTVNLSQAGVSNSS